MPEREAAIIVSTSVSVFVVSSKPGVSMSVTVRPSRKNGLDVCTVSVHDMSPDPTRSEDPLEILMN